MQKVSTTPPNHTHRMGELVLSSEEMEAALKNNNNSTAPTTSVVAAEEEKKDGLVKWERFLPRMVLRVLLVEADDSTRQIISALLRKSSYRGLFLSFLS